jgi:sigma-E factor negative regulatory protein RseA
MNEELDSQLSAMFDDELPPEQCELVARRLGRDQDLKARWGRYAMIGAAIRAEHGVPLEPRLARRVSQAIYTEPSLAEGPALRRPRRLAAAWWQPVASSAVAAGVATAAILWMRTQGAIEAPPPRIADTAAPAPAPVASRGGSSASSYVVPRVVPDQRLVVPGTQMANYLIAHSQVSSPVAGQTMTLAALVAGDGPGTAGTSPGSEDLFPPDDVQDGDAKSVE